MAKEVKVLGGWSCPYTHQVELALKLKGIPYDHIEEDVWKKSPSVLEFNPIIPIYKKDVPVLVHHGKQMAESPVILEYIEETWGVKNPLLPKDPQERAYARLLAKFINDKFIPNFRIACWCEGEEQKKCMEQTKENLIILERQLKGKKFFGGNAIGLADVAGSYIAFWTGVIQKVNGVALINEENHPNLLKWTEEYLRSDIVKESLPDREKLTASYQAVKQALLAKKSSAN